MKLDDARIKKLLREGSYLSDEDITKAAEQAEMHRTPLADYLLNEGIINKNILGQAIAESYQVPYSDLSTNQPTKDQVLEISEKDAKQFRIVLYSKKDSKVVVATDNPVQGELFEKLLTLFPNQKFVVTFSLPEDIDSVFVHYRKPLDVRFTEIIRRGTNVAPEILEVLFMEAFDLRASDIHFEPSHDDVLLRFRIDGVLRDMGHLPKEYYENILNRIKVQSGLRLDEHAAAQDGAMQFNKGSAVVDIRTSIVPTVEGEKIALRILSSYVQRFNLAELGLAKPHQEKLELSAQKPFGMIIVAGPTGSGKTTTLYALLKILNQSGVNITTIEDPVEYKMHGINQIQVNAFTNLTFAKGLRSIVRQDPDIILVGEIRDQETAEIGVNAALTGHLLLSTFHANDAATVLPRLLDMGIEPFLLASTLDLVIAQRLVRTICSRCRHSVSISGSEVTKGRDDLKKFFPDEKYTLYEGSGCEACGHSGYHGRTAIFELIQITPDMQNLILKNPSTQEIWRLAREQGAHSLFEDGVAKVKNGLTTLDELLRVAEPPKNQ